MRKIYALGQDEIDYIMEYSPDSPVLTMLGNTTALVRSEIRRINAEYILNEVDRDGTEAEVFQRWRTKK